MGKVNWRVPLCSVGMTNSNFGFTTRTIGPNTANSQAMVFTAPFTGTFTKILIQITATTVAASSTLIYGFQGVTNAVANTPPGIPDGTWISSATTDAFNFSAATITDAYIELTGLSASLTKGNSYSIVMRPNTNWTAGYTLTVRAALAATDEQNNVTWYHLNGTTAGTGIPMYGIGTASNWYGWTPPYTIPTNTIIATTAGNANNQVAVQFSLPSTITSYKVRGVWLPSFRMGFGTDTAMAVKIIDSSNTTLQSITVSTNNYRATQNYLTHWFEFTDTMATLTGGTTYYLAIETGNSSNNSLGTFSHHNTYASGFQGITHQCFFRNANTGLWNAGTSTPEIQMTQGELVLEDVTSSGGGGGGMIVHPGMAGGMRG